MDDITVSHAVEGAAVREETELLIDEGREVHRRQFLVLVVREDEGQSALERAPAEF